MGLFAKLFGGGVFGLRVSCSRKARASAPPPAIFSQELHDAVEAATVSCRESTEHGPRVMIISHALGGAFIFDRAEVVRRIGINFPELGDEAVKRGLRHLESRARLAAAPPLAVKRRDSWVHGWTEQR